MADLAHLEQMGRELKCPICLSLLKSAVSLMCNHVFCNSCIMESMKSVSDCPVCKVPFRRREVRAAPHMDNLVNIYKSMEATAGVNIFATQTAPPAKHSDYGPQNNSEKISDAPHAELLPCTNSKRKRLTKGKQKDLDSAKPNSGSSTLPSFPAKKRVRVTPYPPAETPPRPEKTNKQANPCTQFEANRLSQKTGNQDAYKQEDAFSPFFWLRERNADEEEDGDDSQELDAQQTAESSLLDIVPCFSDIKDSQDDEIPIKTTPTSRPNFAEALDSEMFEWTQRACSPELCSTPLIKRTAMHGEGLDDIQENDRHENLQNVESNEIIEPVGSKRNSLKKTRSNTKKQRKQARPPPGGTDDNDLDDVLHGLPEGSSEIAKNSRSESENSEENKPANRQRKGRKRWNRASIRYKRKRTKNSMNCIAIAEADKELSSENIEVINQKAEKDTVETAPIESIAGAMVEKRERNSRWNRKLQSQRKHTKTSKLDDVFKVLDAVQTNPDNEAKIQDDHLNSGKNLPALSCKHGKNNEVLARKYPKRSQVQNEGNKKQRRTKDQANRAAITKDADIMPIVSLKATDVEDGQTTTSSPQVSKKVASKNDERPEGILFATRETIMQRCQNNNYQIQCAFCHSGNDTEVSGEMMHYFDGKPVAADYNEGLNIIHAHKNCTEWAPNVYFEDEMAINLATELGRSKRIKCSCCGIKGAALGCFEKSCRKSFHFTCAKLTPECRWDYDNFVMLCPLHSSSKLPNETSQHQECRKRTAQRRRPQASTMQTSCSDGAGLMWKWPCGTPCKWVLCCSALANAEKETLSKFTKLTGVPISRAWNPAVTHVIASTDENGSCKRTLKFLMAIIAGKWILTINWIKACMEAKEPVEEERYEIKVDVNGIRDGPQLGRLRAINKQPKLFHQLRFYFSGGFAPAYKGYLQDLIIAAGGVVLQRKPIPREQQKLLGDSFLQMTFIIYSAELPDMHHGRQDAVISRRQDEARALADATGAKVASNTWIIDCIAACKLQL